MMKIACRVKHYVIMASLMLAGVFLGLIVGINTRGTPAAPVGRPIDDWTSHTDVDHHFPHHPSALAHHWCKKITDTLTECQLYDGDGPNARLVGVEPIVSDSTFRSFTKLERRFWHWHKTSTSKIIVPGGSLAQNRAANLRRSTTHGKTILLWDPRDTIFPIGPPRVIPH